MSMIMPKPLELSNATPRRTPNLAIRDMAKSNAGLASEESNNERQGELKKLNSRPDARSAESMSSAGKHQRTVPRQGQSSTPKQSAKKKGSGVLGFLTLREPSTSALEEFAEQEKRKLANQKAKILPGVSSQKIPEHVPKVNSKWNGLPESTRSKVEKDKARSSRELANRNSSTSANSQHSGKSDRTLPHSAVRPCGSLSSMPQAGRRSQDKGRNLLGSISEPVGPLADSQTQRFHATAPSSKTLPAFRTTPYSSNPAPDLYTTIRPDQDFPGGPEEDVLNPRELRSQSVQSQTIPAASMDSGFPAQSTQVGYQENSPPASIVSNVAVTQTILEEYMCDDLTTLQAPTKIRIYFNDTLNTSPPISHAKQAIVVAPTIAPSRTKDKEVLPWEMIEPPPENHLTVPSATTKDSGHKHWRFGSRARLGRK